MRLEEVEKVDAPEPLSWDQKELFRNRKHNHEFGGGPPSSLWRASSSPLLVAGT